MSSLRVAFAAAVIVGARICIAQNWAVSYEAGLSAARLLNWGAARADFSQATRSRPDDSPSPTNLPGPPTEARRWRDGAVYSPNFLKAYCGYRQALLMTDLDAQTTLFGQVASEFEKLLNKRQVSREAYYFVCDIYARLGDDARLQRVEVRYGRYAVAHPWKVDTEIVRPEELAAISNAFSQASSLGTTPGTTPGGSPASTPPPASSAPGVGPGVQATGAQPSAGGIPFLVQHVIGKYAIVIGERNADLPDGLPYAVDDAVRIRASLVTFAGYPAANVTLITDGSVADINAVADALAKRIPNGATVLIYFTGIGVNLNGHDYLAASDSNDLTSGADMISKQSLLGKFLPKSSRVFAFFQANRNNGSTDGVAGAFGSEEIPVGSVAQMQATISGGRVNPTYRNGKEIGLFSEAFIEALIDMQSNEIPILEFGWQVFFHMRRGDSGLAGGSSQQTCTLPLLNHLASDARF